MVNQLGWGDNCAIWPIFCPCTLNPNLLTYLLFSVSLTKTNSRVASDLIDGFFGISLNKLCWTNSWVTGDLRRLDVHVTSLQWWWTQCKCALPSRGRKSMVQWYVGNEHGLWVTLPYSLLHVYIVGEFRGVHSIVDYRHLVVGIYYPSVIKWREVNHFWAMVFVTC